VERQGSPLAGICSSVMGGRSIDGSLNNRASQRSDAKEGAEDGELDDENVEAWELDDDDNDEDGESDYGDSGYYNDFNKYTARTHQDIVSRISGDSTISTYNQFLELLFQLCIILSTKSFLNGQPSSMLLIYFSSILRFSAEYQKFQLTR
jgi:hypothetical protein